MHSFITLLGVDKFFLWRALILFRKYSEMLGVDIKSRSGKNFWRWCFGMPILGYILIKAFFWTTFCSGISLGWMYVATTLKSTYSVQMCPLLRNSSIPYPSSYILDAKTAKIASAWTNMGELMAVFVKFVSQNLRALALILHFIWMLAWIAVPCLLWPHKTPQNSRKKGQYGSTKARMSSHEHLDKKSSFSNKLRS